MATWLPHKHALRRVQFEERHAELEALEIWMKQLMPSCGNERSTMHNSHM